MLVLTNLRDRLSARARTWLRLVGQFYCGLSGHEAVLTFVRFRMLMQCTHCGHETPGWDLSPRPGWLNLRVIRGDRSVWSEGSIQILRSLQRRCA